MKMSARAAIVGLGSLLLALGCSDESDAVDPGGAGAGGSGGVDAGGGGAGAGAGNAGGADAGGGGAGVGGGGAEPTDCSLNECRYVRPPGETYGSGDGSTWDDAFSGLPGGHVENADGIWCPALERGVTYFLADGSYPSYRFVDEEDGEAWIVIKKATENDHGTASGWQAGYGDGQAVLGPSLIFNRSYYEINGQRRNEGDWTDSAAYGFVGLTNVLSNPYEIYNQPGGDHLILKYVDLGYPVGTDYAEPGVKWAGMAFVSSSDIYVGYSHLHDLGKHIHIQATDNGTIEHSYLGTGWSKEAILATESASRWTIRHNLLVDTCRDVPDDDTACGATADIAAFRNGGPFDDWSIYGNVISNPPGAPDRCHTDGVIFAGEVGDGQASGWRIYNNVFAGILGQNAGVHLTGADNAVQDNLWFWPSGQQGGSVGASGTATNNWCFGSDQCGNVDIVGDGDPFVDYAGGDFRLSEPLGDASSALGAEFDAVDRYGTMRGADGIWDLGAYEYEAASP